MVRFEKSKWIWTSKQESNTYCYARRSFEVIGVVLKANLRIVADSRYQAWVNGRYVGQGPVPFRRPYLFFDSFEVGPLLQEGKNVLCVLGHFIGEGTQTYTPGKAGILAELELEYADGSRWSLASDETWKVKLCEAWEKDVPRRTWATGFCEFYDARRESVGWNDPEFDDSGWVPAHRVEQGKLHLLPRIVPPLEEVFVSPVKLTGAWRAVRTAPGVEAFSELTGFLDSEPLHPVNSREMRRIESDFFGAARCVLTFSGDGGLALTFDLGVETAGQLEFEVETSAGGRIDLCGAELLRDGRPWCYRKRGHYACSYITRGGRQTWRTFSWSGMRYLHLVLRRFKGEVILHRLGVWRRQAQLKERATFTSNDEELNQIWDIGCRTLRLGSQEVQVDCPTREQSAYWGDGTWTSLWTMGLSGDSSFWKHIIISARQVQRPDGQLPGSIFSGIEGGDSMPFYDFSLILIWGAWEYYWRTGDGILCGDVLPVAERILQWYRQRLGATGLIEIDTIAACDASEGLVFIDHPGWPWHNSPSPGLDHRGIGAGLNLFYLKALTAYLELTRRLEHRPRFCSEEEIKLLKERVNRAFWNPERGLYVDALIDGEQSSQVSQQINALAIITGVAPPECAKSVLRKVLDPDDKSLCRCTPYFWLYLFQAMSSVGMHGEMLEIIRKYWGAMARAGATTWWETFLGDERDSLCHPYGTAPNHVLQTEILGVKPASPGFVNTRISPRFDLIERAEGVIPLPIGKIRIGWKPKSSNKRELCLEIEGEFTVELVLPSGWVIAGTTRESRVRIKGNSTLRVAAEKQRG